MKDYKGIYTGNNLSHIAFPLGGLGAGMICLQGNGMPGIFSIRNEPDVHFEPNVFSAVFIKQGAESAARVLEGQIPYNKIFGGGGDSLEGMGNGLHGKNYGLPRFEENDFSASFPFAAWNFSDSSIPLDVSLVGWSPFVPLDPDNSSLPVAALEYTFANAGNDRVDAVYSFNSFNFMGTDRKKKLPADNKTMSVFRRKNGFILSQQPLLDRPYMEGSFYASVSDENTFVNADLYDGGHYDKLTMLWNDISKGRYSDSEHITNMSPGGSISVPFTLNPGESKTISLKLAWYVPNTTLRTGYESAGGACGCSDGDCIKPTHKPWYAARYDDVDHVMQFFSDNYRSLREKTALFSETFFDSTLPDEVLEAVSVNLSILKSPTILRQTDGRLWCWEGCCDSSGCCSGSCTHVWNYAQALCHLFPSLERTLRETEFNECQNDQGHQTFRASLPIRESGHTFYAAADGQLGGIMKMYREWRISGDRKWIESYWDKMKASLDYCIRTWDPKRRGVLSEPHHNTYDIEFWGPDGMCSSFYLGALK
ncbi:MAG: GH116 family glycosyl-hydrolase, partial [Clostridia bacterium]